MVTTTVTLAAGIFAILVLSMSVGIFFGRPRLRGSCGGVGGEGACSVCGAGSESECRKEH